jgi:hypothetical protein
MPNNDRRLIEDLIPIREISAEASREKSLRHGNISTLHLWWAQRPIVAARAAVYGALVPAPTDPTERETTIHFGRDVLAYELDMGEGAFLLSAAYAQQLLTPPAPEPETPATTGDLQQGQQPSHAYTPSEEAGKTVINDRPPLPIPVPPPAQPVSAGQGGQRYRLSMQIKQEDFFEVTKALERLSDRAATLDTTMIVIATARPGQPFNANSLHNLVVEPMVEESDVKVLEEQVEG